MADRFQASYNYGLGRRPVFGSHIPAFLTSHLVGQLRVEGLWTTDNTIHAFASPSGGMLPVKTVTVEETDMSTPSPIKKTWTFTGYMSPFEHDGQADQHSTFRFTLELNAEPAVA